MEGEFRQAAQEHKIFDALRLRVNLELTIILTDGWRWWGSLPVRMRRGRGRHRFTLIGRKLVENPAGMKCVNIHEGIASVGIACSRDARQRCTEWPVDGIWPRVGKPLFRHTIIIPCPSRGSCSSGSRGGGLGGLNPPFRGFFFFSCLSVYENSHGPGP